MTPEPIHWLWPNNLAHGYLALFDGDPVLGKSMVALDLCARLTTGRPFPLADTAVEPSSALFLGAEDGTLDTVLPRLAALGADLSRVHVLRQEFLDKHGGFRLPSHTAALELALADTGARMIIIDPIIAFLDKGVNVANEQSVRRVLAPLVALAARNRSVPILIRHINKMLGTCSIYRGGGSIAFQASCRSSWLFGRDPVHKDRCVMAQVKNNKAAPQLSLAYSIQAQEQGLTVSWLGTSKLSGNQLLVGAGLKPDLPGLVERAGDFLLEFLKEGPRPTTEIWPAAQQLGIARRTATLLPIQGIGRKPTCGSLR